MKKMEGNDFFSRKSTSRRSKSSSHRDSEITEENSLGKFNIPSNFVPIIKPKKECLSSKTFHVFNLDNDESFANESDSDSEQVIPTETNNAKRDSFVVIQKVHQPLLLKLLNNPKKSQQRKSLFFSHIHKVNHDIDNAQLTFMKKEYQIPSNIKINDNNTNNCNNHDKDPYKSIIEM
jgi:hypothetical protein